MTREQLQQRICERFASMESRPEMWASTREDFGLQIVVFVEMLLWPEGASSNPEMLELMRRLFGGPVGSSAPIDTAWARQAVAAARGFIEEKRPSQPEARHEFDPTFIAALAHVIFGARLHERAREDTMGVLLYYGAFHAEPDETKRDAFIADLGSAIDAYAVTSPFQTIFGTRKSGNEGAFTDANVRYAATTGPGHDAYRNLISALGGPCKPEVVGWCDIDVDGSPRPALVVTQAWPFLPLGTDPAPIKKAKKYVALIPEAGGFRTVEVPPPPSTRAAEVPP